MSLDPAIDQQLVSIYGQGKTQQIRNYLREFQPYKSNFAPQTPTLREAGGRKLLLISCPLSITPWGRSLPLVLNVGLLFTMQFPESPPHCAVMLNQGERLVNNHPLVAGSGVVRLPLLPYLQALTHAASLMDLLLACTAAFEESYPVDLPPEGSSAGTLPPPPPAVPQHHVDPSPPSQPSSGSTSNSNRHPHVVEAPPAPAPARPEEKQLTEKVLFDLKLKGEEHIRFKMEALVHLTALKEHIKQQEKSEQVLADRKQVLQTTGPRMHEISELVSKWKTNNEMSSADACIVPQDELHAQMIEVLAQNHAADDCMELLEKRLKKGLITFDDYLKSVQELSRRQFISKLLLKRVMARLDADATTRGLARKFPGFDPQMISEVLRSSDYDAAVTEAKLADLQ